MSHVLILMASYNGAAYLQVQLDSIAAQTHSDWSLWVSDDGSTDQTCAMIDRFGASVHQQVHRVAGPGLVSSAQNFLSLLCHPDLPVGTNTYVAFCDQDDLWYPEKLRLGLEALAPVEGPSLYGAGYDLIDANGEVVGHAPPPPDGGLRAADPFLWTVVGGLTSLASPQAVRLLRRGGQPDVPYHDWWASLVVAACGGELVLRPDRVLGYRQHAANVIGASGRRGAALRRIKAVLDGTYGGWVGRNVTALLDADLPLTQAARTVAQDLAKGGVGPGRVAMLRRHGLRRRDRLSTFAAYLAALTGRL